MILTVRGTLRVGLGQAWVQSSIFRASEVSHGFRSRRIRSGDRSETEREKLCPGGNPPNQTESSYTTARAASFHGFWLRLDQRVRWFRSVQKSSAESERFAALRISQEAEMADLDQAGRQDVEEKPADKLDGVQRHELGLVVMGRVSPAKRDPAILHRDEAPVGDGNPMGIACQILEHLLRAAKWALGMDHPALLLALSKEPIELRRL